MSEVTKLPFVLQKHKAFKAGLHYDFRIKYPSINKLISFVIVGDNIINKFSGIRKVFLIRTPDHSVAWLKKEYVIIPKGEYGGGTIEIVQKGFVDVVVWKKNYINIIIDSGEEKKYLNGNYHMFYVSDKKRAKSDRISEVWLMVCKEENAMVREESTDNFLVRIT